MSSKTKKVSGKLCWVKIYIPKEQRWNREATVNFCNKVFCNENMKLINPRRHSYRFYSGDYSEKGFNNP